MCYGPFPFTQPLRHGSRIGNPEVEYRRIKWRDRPELERQRAVIRKLSLTLHIPVFFHSFSYCLAGILFIALEFRRYHFCEDNFKITLSLKHRRRQPAIQTRIHDTHTHTHGHTHKYARTHAHTHLRTNKHTLKHTCLHTSTHVHRQTLEHTLVCIHIHKYIHTPVHTRSHTHTRTYIHEHTLSFSISHSLSLTYTHTHIRTHSDTCIHTL